MKEKISKKEVTDFLERLLNNSDKQLLEINQNAEEEEERIQKIRDKKRGLLIDSIRSSGEYISYVSRDDTENIKKESLKILKNMAIGLLYSCNDSRDVTGDISEYVLTGVEFADNNPRGDVEILVCASYIASILRDDNLTGEHVFSKIVFQAAVQLLETVLREFNSSLYELIQESNSKAQNKDLKLQTLIKEKDLRVEQNVHGVLMFGEVDLTSLNGEDVNIESCDISDLETEFDGSYTDYTLYESDQIVLESASAQDINEYIQEMMQETE